MSQVPFDYAGATALITGASRGIGADIARALARRGVPTLVLVARTRPDMEALAEELHAAYGTRVEVIAADLSAPDAAAAIIAETDERDLAINLLVNNAGFGDYGYFDQRPLDRQQRMIAVNCTSLLELTRLYLPAMLADGRDGGIVNIASSAAFQPVPFMSAYGATKAFVLSFSEALWAENRDREGGPRVVCVCPGSTDTAFDFGDARGRGSYENAPRDTPQEVAAATLAALDANASYAVVGLDNYAGSLAIRLLPRAAVARVGAAVFRPNADGTARPAGSGTGKVRRALVAGAAVAAGVTAGAVLYFARRRR